jgi:hypothetical protein
MKRFLIPAVALAFAMPASAEFYRSPVVEACHEAIVASLATNQTYDAFIPTEFLDTARILVWQAPYSKENPIEVATVVLLEGRARLLAQRSTNAAEEVTAKCGLNYNDVVASEILKGHDLPDGGP